jgi:hypothetical protein
MMLLLNYIPSLNKHHCSTPHNPYIITTRDFAIHPLTPCNSFGDMHQSQICDMHQNLTNPNQDTPHPPSDGMSDMHQKKTSHGMSDTHQKKKPDPPGGVDFVV